MLVKGAAAACVAKLVAGFGQAVACYRWEGVTRPALLPSRIGSDTRALCGAMLPLHANVSADRELVKTTAAASRCQPRTPALPSARTGRGLPRHPTHAKLGQMRAHHLPHHLPPRRRRTARGFTLVEQLAVIALVGTVSATALPALTEFNQHAERTVLASLAASAGSAMVINQAGCLVSQGQAAPGRCQPLQDCTQVQGLLMQPLPDGVVVPAQLLDRSGGTCQLLRVRDGVTAAFYGVATGG